MPWGPETLPPPPPPSRTKWTRLVHPSVLTGHVSSAAGAEGAAGGAHSGPDGIVFAPVSRAPEQGAAGAERRAPPLTAEEAAATYGKGFSLLERMGYLHDPAGGTERAAAVRGSLATPLAPEPKLNRRGLAAAGEGARARRRIAEESAGFGRLDVQVGPRTPSLCAPCLWALAPLRPCSTLITLLLS